MVFCVSVRVCFAAVVGGVGAGVVVLFVIGGVLVVVRL